MQHLVGTIRGHDHHKLFYVRILATNNVFGSTGSGPQQRLDQDQGPGQPSGRHVPLAAPASGYLSRSLVREGGWRRPNASFVAVQQSGRDWGTDSASADGINLRDGVTAKLDGRAMRKDCARAQLTHDIRHHIRHHIPHVHLTCGAIATKYKKNQFLAAHENPGVNPDICPQPYRGGIGSWCPPLFAPHYVAWKASRCLGTHMALVFVYPE